MSSNRPSFNGACAGAGSEKAAANKADSKVVSRICTPARFAAAEVLHGVFYAPKGSFADAMPGLSRRRLLRHARLSSLANKKRAVFRPSKPQDPHSAG